MRIGQLAEQLGTTPNAIRYYERSGILSAPRRSANGYRAYDERDAERLRVLVGLRQLDLPLAQAAQLSSLCADGRCAEVSEELRSAITDKRVELAKRITELRYLDQRLAHLDGRLVTGEPPKTLITIGKEDCP
ncbi:MAG: MerR family transcriptional regulator [Chloroflexota bacterium]